MYTFSPMQQSRRSVEVHKSPTISPIYQPTQGLKSMDSEILERLQFICKSRVRTLTAEYRLQQRWTFIIREMQILHSIYELGSCGNLGKFDTEFTIRCKFTSIQLGTTRDWQQTVVLNINWLNEAKSFTKSHWTKKWHHVICWVPSWTGFLLVTSFFQSLNFLLQLVIWF